ncbi:RNA ligase [Arthrobacter phage Racecar]|nr:RNA ligase [Arthrobacter phage Racecar]QFG12902.1 RNA ligase [Arthrobacter phage Mimi]
MKWSVSLTNTKVKEKMTYIHDLLDLDELAQMMDDKRISKQVHPSLPISIYNYTNRAQFMNKWTKAERVCRGLIIEDGTGEVIARGPEKFFNYGQTGAPDIAMTDHVTVTRKEDGSLGIGWLYKGHYGIATRGSFTSDQALHATKNLTKDDKANIEYAEERNITRIFEIVYPENRIVLDYGTRDELIPLGTVSNNTGLILYRPTTVLKHEYKMLFSEALELPIPANEEGYVLDIHNVYGMVTGHVKLKGEEYKILHGLLTNTNSRRIWIQMAARACHHLIHTEKAWANLGGDPEDFKRVNVEEDFLESLLSNVPDEFYDWVTRQIDRMQDQVDDWKIQAESLATILKGIDSDRERYEAVKHHPLCREILQFAKTGNFDTVVLKSWKLVKPAGDETPFKQIED